MLTRSIGNPIITRAGIPDMPPHFADVTSVFNPGAALDAGITRLMLRVQSRGRETFLLMAESLDGRHFTMAREPVRLEGLERAGEHIYHVYDPRLTRIDDAWYVMLAADVDDGCLLGTARTADFVRFEFLGFGPDRDIRNGVLFPERIDGRYIRLDRPNRIALTGATSGDEIRLSVSDDLVGWEPVASVMRGRPHSWDERIGSGPPPVKTREGWLHVYHGIATHFAQVNVYQAGVVLLDLADPSKVRARCRDNILEPREAYELMGQVPNVVFPTGMIVEGITADGFAARDCPVRIYYGAADTAVGLATTTVGDLLRAAGA